MPVILYTLCSWRKCQATEKLQDRYCHVIPPGELYLDKKKLKVLDHTVYISPGEIFEIFAEFDDDLTMGNESYSKYINLA